MPKIRNIDANIEASVVIVTKYLVIVTLLYLLAFSSLLMEVKVQYKLYISKTISCRLITANSTVARSIASAYTSKGSSFYLSRLIHLSMMYVFQFAQASTIPK